MQIDATKPITKRLTMAEKADFTYEYRQMLANEIAVVSIIVVVTMFVLLPTMIIAMGLAMPNEGLALVMGMLIIALYSGMVVFAVNRLSVPMTVGVANGGLQWLNRRTGCQRTIPWEQVTRNETDYFSYGSQQWIRLRLWCDDGRTKISIQVDPNNAAQLERFTSLLEATAQRLNKPHSRYRTSRYAR